MNTMCRKISLCSLIMASILLPAQTFESARLENAAQVLGISQALDTIAPNQTKELVTKDGLSIIVRISGSGLVEHIGIPLFNEDMRTLMPSPVYDFMEYATLNWRYKLTPNQLHLSKVIFKKGSWNCLISDNLSTCDCSIENRDDKLYVITWQRDSQDVAVVGIPLEYELLSNESRRNIEREFISKLAEYKTPPSFRVNRTITEGELKVYGTQGLFVLEGDNYLMPELNQNVYFTLRTVYENVDTIIHEKPVTMRLEDVVPTPVADAEFPAETLTNLMICNLDALPDLVLDIDFHLSDYRHERLSLPLSQLKSFCHERGAKIFFAVSSLKEEKVKGMLLMNNTAKGYNHLFSISMPTTMLTKQEPKAKADAYLYIPPLKRESLFGKPPTKKSGAKIYQ